MGKARKPVEGDFPLLIVRKRGPKNMPMIIKMAKNVSVFCELLIAHFTARNIKRISTRTKNQANNPFWFIYKRCVITGTMARRVINQNKKNEPNKKLNKYISRFSPGKFTNEAMIYGIENEKLGINTFFKIFKKNHNNAKINEIGLVLHKKFPFIAGSPDSIFSCSCCSSPYLVELKCPHRLAVSGIENWQVLEYFDSDQNLRNTHTYFNQINLYQGLLGLNTAFFVVYARGKVISKEIPFDDDFFQYQIKNIQEYYMNHYLPTVIGMKI